uniref:SMK-1 domain-containing protein n=1 Tax=Macrostomum lignano TaxID=282301 RepID=A0A1I8F7J3_9PLAT
AEQQGNVERLQQLQELTTSLLLLNHRRLLESLTMPDDRLLATLGMLEYRPSGRVPHRNFVLGQAANPRQVLKFDRQPGLAERIRRQYRLQYLLDCALPPPSPLDDVQFLTLALRGEGGGGGGGGSSAGFGQQSELSGLVLSGRLRIASDIVQDANLIAELMLDLARFLRELCCCCPSGQCGLGQLAGLQEQLLNGGRLLEALGCMYTRGRSVSGCRGRCYRRSAVPGGPLRPLLRDHLLHEAADRPDSDLLAQPPPAVPVRVHASEAGVPSAISTRRDARLLQPLLSNTPVDESVEPQNDGGQQMTATGWPSCSTAFWLGSGSQPSSTYSNTYLLEDLAPLIVNIVEFSYWPDLLQAVAKAQLRLLCGSRCSSAYNQLREKAAKDAGHGAGNITRDRQIRLIVGASSFETATPPGEPHAQQKES